MSIGLYRTKTYIAVWNILTRFISILITLLVKREVIDIARTTNPLWRFPCTNTPTIVVASPIEIAVTFFTASPIRRTSTIPTTSGIRPRKDRRTTAERSTGIPTYDSTRTAKLTSPSLTTAAAPKSKSKPTA